MPTDLVLTTLSLWLGSLFTYTGSLKLLTPLDERVRSVAGYRLLPSAPAQMIARLLPYAELACGGVILLTPLVRAGAVGAALTGLTFSLATGWALARGLKTECGCAGKHSGLIRPSTFVRACLVATSAIVVGITGWDRPLAGGWLVFAFALLPAGVVMVRSRWLRAAAHHHHHTGQIHRPIAESNVR